MRSRLTTSILCIFAIISSLMIVPVEAKDNERKPVPHHPVKQNDVLEVPTQRDLMVAYMRQQNRKLPLKVAYKLADGIIANHEEYGLPINVQLGLVKKESRFVQFAKGKQGDTGFFQVVVPMHNKTMYALYRVKKIYNTNIWDPYTNARVGGEVFHICMDQNKGDIQKSLLCYNGSTNDKHRKYAKSVLKFSKEFPVT